MMIVIKYKVVIRCDKNRVEYAVYKLSYYLFTYLIIFFKIITRYMKLETKHQY